jgi:hypothetical protein
VTYSELVQRLKIAIYQEAQSNSDFVRLDEAAKKYGFEYQEGLIAEAQKDLVATGFITGPKPIDGDSTSLGKITGAGRREIEEKFGSKDGVGQILQPIEETEVHNLSASSVSTGTPEATHPTLGVFQRVEPTASTTPTFSQSRGNIDYARPAGPSVLTIDSADWTGISERLETSPAIIEQIAKHISEIDQLVEKSGLTNTERQKAKAITDSLRLLVASPEPEWKAIAVLLTSQPLTAILNVAAIVQIVLKLFGIG